MTDIQVRSFPFRISLEAQSKDARFYFTTAIVEWWIRNQSDDQLAKVSAQLKEQNSFLDDFIKENFVVKVKN